MTKQNPFDAAMKGMEMDLAILREGPGTKDRDDAVTQYEAAIRLLEAAGALTISDKGWLKCRVDWVIPEYTPAMDGMVCPGAAMKGRFNALLNALADEEKP